MLRYPILMNLGRYADFHSLRHITGSLLAASGVHPKVAQSIMRHSDINLTMSRYSHTYLEQESETISRLPDFSLNRKQRAKATGTDGKNADKDIVVTELQRFIFYLSYGPNTLATQARVRLVWGFFLLAQSLSLSNP